MNNNEKFLTKSNSVMTFSTSRLTLPDHEEKIYTLYACSRLNEKTASGKEITAGGRLEAQNLLLQMANTLGISPSVEEIKAISFDSGLYLWEDEGICAIARIAFEGEKYARINTVFTSPEKRGKGYAAALVSALAKELLNKGLTPTVLADEDNPISNRMYLSLGFTTEGKVYEYLKNSVSHSENAIFYSGHHDGKHN